MVDLFVINSSLCIFGCDLDLLNVQVDVVQYDVGVICSELVCLEKVFMDFVVVDVKVKELLFVEICQVKICQELEICFGYYGEVCCQIIGILQVVDILLVCQDIICVVSENLMLVVLGYWFVLVLVVLVVWFNDYKDLVECVLVEVICCDDEKISLLFVLVSCCVGCLVVLQQWMDCYLGMQNLVELDCQIVVFIDVIVVGVFGVEIVLICVVCISDWIEELFQCVGFIESQCSQWIDVLCLKMLYGDDSVCYLYLQQYSFIWLVLQVLFNVIVMYGVVVQYFQVVFSGEVCVIVGLVVDVDVLLIKLVFYFDVEELLLCCDEELCCLIIEENGDCVVVMLCFQLQDFVLEYCISFIQLLINVVMYLEILYVLCVI